MDGKKGIKNIFYGVIAQAITIILGIIIPRLVLVNLGSEANGLLTSVNNILTYMSLLEAGVGTATQQALYEPVAEQKHHDINRIMAATHYFYKRTGYVYTAIVILVSVVYTLFVNSDIPKMSVFLVVLLTGLSGVLSYFFQGKYRILLTAEGKGYILTNIGTIRTIGASLTKAVLLICGFNVVAVQTSYFIYNFIQMLVIVVYMRRHYKWIDLSVEPAFEALAQKNAVLVHQISGLIFNNTDVLLLTFFASLKVVSVYSLYALIFGYVKTVAVILSESFIYALGQSYHDRKRFMPMFDAYEVYNMALTFTLFCIAKIFILPFLTLYTQGVTDIQYIDKLLPWLFAAFYLLHNARNSSAHVINFAQHFEKTKWRSVLESVINLTVSILAVHRWGIYGVLIGTIAALLYRANDMILYASKLLQRSPLVTYRRWFVNIVIFVFFDAVFSKINLSAAGYLQMVVKAAGVSICVSAVFAVVNMIFEKDAVWYGIRVIKRTLRRR